MIAFFGLPFFGSMGTLWRKIASASGLRVDARAADAVTVIVELMFPGDAAPSAESLGIAASVKAISTIAAATPDGTAWLDHWATAQGASDFLSLDQKDKQHALEAALASDDDRASQFVWLIRYHAGLAYYSASAVKATFPYAGPPQPDGFGDFAGPPQ
jgi:hypothetical protein